MGATLEGRRVAPGRSAGRRARRGSCLPRRSVSESTSAHTSAGVSRVGDGARRTTRSSARRSASPAARETARGLCGRRPLDHAREDLRRSRPRRRGAAPRDPHLEGHQAGHRLARHRDQAELVGRGSIRRHPTPRRDLEIAKGIKPPAHRQEPAARRRDAVGRELRREPRREDGHQHGRVEHHPPGASRVEAAGHNRGQSDRERGGERRRSAPRRSHVESAPCRPTPGKGCFVERPPPAGSPRGRRRRRRSERRAEHCHPDARGAGHGLARPLERNAACEPKAPEPRPHRVGAGNERLRLRAANDGVLCEGARTAPHQPTEGASPSATAPRPRARRPGAVGLRRRHRKDGRVRSRAGHYWEAIRGSMRSNPRRRPLVGRGAGRA